MIWIQQKYHSFLPTTMSGAIGEQITESSRGGKSIPECATNYSCHSQLSVD